MSDDMLATGAPKDPGINELREQLQDATRRLHYEEKLKKADATVHRERIKAINEEIDEIMQQLETLGVK